jgi:hypothetical protein
MKVQLTSAEIFHAAGVGLMRQAQNIQKGRQPAYGSGSKNDWQIHIEGALGEFAVAKAFRIFWSGNVGQLSLPDVGCFQVRTTPSHEFGDLILHPSDADDATFILVTGCNGYYVLRGWLRAVEGKKQCYWKDPSKKKRHAFFVPQKVLHPLDTLQMKEARS